MYWAVLSCGARCIMLDKVVLINFWVGELLDYKCDHSVESCWEVLSCSSIYDAVRGDTKLVLDRGLVARIAASCVKEMLIGRTTGAVLQKDSSTAHHLLAGNNNIVALLVVPEQYCSRLSWAETVSQPLGKAGGNTVVICHYCWKVAISLTSLAKRH